MECVHSCDQQPCLFIKTKESFCIKKEFNSHRIYVLLQYGRLNIVCSSNMVDMTSQEHTPFAMWQSKTQEKGYIAFT